MGAVVEGAEGGVDGGEARGAFTAEEGGVDGGVVEFTMMGDAAEEEAAAGHVAATDEVDGEEETVAEGAEEDVGVLAGADAAEEDDFRGAWEHGSYEGDMAFEGFAEAGVGVVDGNVGEAAELLE